MLNLAEVEFTGRQNGSKPER